LDQLEKRQAEFEGEIEKQRKGKDVDDGYIRDLISEVQQITDSLSQITKAELPDLAPLFTMIASKKALAKLVPESGNSDDPDRQPRSEENKKWGYAHVSSNTNILYITEFRCDDEFF